MAAVAVVMPLRLSGDDWRQRAAHHVLGWYDEHFPAWELMPCDAPGPWSKGRAVNRAVERTDAPTLVIADADSFMLDPAALTDAVKMCQRGAPWVTPHTMVYRLDRVATVVVQEGKRVRLDQLDRKPYRGPPGGGMIVISRELYVRSRGLDERFEGWGGEDVSFGGLLKRLWGSTCRAGGDLVHLWHPPAAPNLRGSERNEELVEEWKRACRRRGDIWGYLERLPEIRSLVR